MALKNCIRKKYPLNKFYTTGNRNSFMGPNTRNQVGVGTISHLVSALFTSQVTVNRRIIVVEEHILPANFA